MINSIRILLPYQKPWYVVRGTQFPYSAPVLETVVRSTWYVVPVFCSRIRNRGTQYVVRCSPIPLPYQKPWYVVPSRITLPYQKPRYVVRGTQFPYSAPYQKPWYLVPVFRSRIRTSGMQYVVRSSRIPLPDQKPWQVVRGTQFPYSTPVSVTVVRSTWYVVPVFRSRIRNCVTQ